MMSHPHDVPRQMWRLLEPIHAVVYFSPEPLQELRRTGYRGFWMGYFAGRAAPLGPASAELVHALFYNFSFQRVAKALPAAWRFASPEAAIGARQRGASAALQRQLGALAGSSEVAIAVDLALQAVRAAPIEGRPLFAANLALPLPSDPVARLWHLATLLREHRGDGHVAALLGAGVGGREAHVLHSLASGVPPAVYRAARDFEDDEWRLTLSSLVDKGYAGDDGVLTAEGRALKTHIESRTDELAMTAYVALTPSEVATMVRALGPFAMSVVRAGEVPVQSPMGLDLRDLTEG